MVGSPDVILPQISSNLSSSSVSENSNTLRVSDISSLNICDTNLKCLYTNCDSITNKLSEFDLLLSVSKPHLVLLTETKLRKSILSQEVFPLQNYVIYRKDRL